MPGFRLFLVLAVCALAAGQGSNPIVRVAHGVLQGAWKTYKGRTYASFEGVPYARRPVGKYRFREPQQLKPWPGVWDATKKLPICLQYDPLQQMVLGYSGELMMEGLTPFHAAEIIMEATGPCIGSENCLFLNIYTPKPTAGAALPVVVFIHGGAFMFGAGSIYDVSAMMQKDVVVVTLNYRLGPLGFLSTGDEVVPGNAGLKDQAFALHWIKNNIMMFGGNPDSVTLTGCSAGGASVHYQYLSPLSKGTFHRGIAFSGSAFAPWTHAIKPAEKAKTLASIIGCPTTTSRELVECLRYRPAEVIVNAQIEMYDWRIHLFTPFTPTVEASNVREPFLTQYPYHAAQSGAMHKLPLITTVTSEEGLWPAAAFLTAPDILPELESRWGELASFIFEYNETLPLNQREAVAAKIKQHYLGGKPVGPETFAQLVQALGDRHFVVDVGKLAQIHAARSGQPVYVYRYSFRGQKSLSDVITRTDKDYGVSHADDVFHVFNLPYTVGDSPDDAKMTDVLVDMIYNYAVTGVPKVSNQGPTWQPVTPGSKELSYLEISSPTKMEMKSSADFGHKSFWDSLGFMENENFHLYRKEEL